MLNRCSLQCLSIALGIALSMPGASAAGYDVPVAPEGDPLPPIQRCVVESLRVNGLLLVQHGWCAWDTEQKMWIPLSSDLARTRVFGIRPIPE
jgi:hypothetical protein